jgi:hypothetical protein
MIVVATEAERKIAESRWKNESILVTGVGGITVYKALCDVDRSEQIINFGYCGSNLLPIGMEISVGDCRLYHPNVEYEEESFRIDGETTCLTSCDFVLKTEIEEPVVFDMELAFILAMGFRNVKSIKIVSDNLSLKQYEELTE